MRDPAKKADHKAAPRRGREDDAVNIAIRLGEHQLELDRRITLRNKPAKPAGNARISCCHFSYFGIAPEFRK
jgi:hypothetical protein